MISSKRLATFLLVTALGVVLPPRPAYAVSSASVHRFQLDGRLGFGGAFHGNYVLAQVDGLYRVVPFLLLGLFVEHPLLHAPSDDYCADGGICTPDYFAFGPRAEFQPFPDWVVGPWLGAELGVALLNGPNPNPSIAPLRDAVVETTVDLGVEVRLPKTWTIGVYLADKIFLAGPYDNDSLNDRTKLISVGVRVAARF